MCYWLRILTLTTHSFHTPWSPSCRAYRPFGRGSLSPSAQRGSKTSSSRWPRQNWPRKTSCFSPVKIKTMADGWYFWILAYIVELKTTRVGFFPTLLAGVGQKLIRHTNTQMTSTKCLSDTEFSEALYRNILGKCQFDPWKASYKLCSENLLEIHFIFILLSSVYCCTRNTLLCKMKFKNEQSLFRPCLARLQICNHLPANVSLSAELSITRILFHDLYSSLIH